MRPLLPQNDMVIGSVNPNQDFNMAAPTDGAASSPILNRVKKEFSAAKSCNSVTALGMEPVWRI
jgi:hypothetical protein